MKKIISLLLLIFLTSCLNIKNKNSALKIIAPTGAPSLAFLNEAQNDNFETNSVPTNIISMMNETSDKDIIVIDTISGLKAIDSGAPYKLAATITSGNFYIAACGNDIDKTMNKGDKIVLFGQNLMPDIIFHYLYGNEFDEEIEYVSSVGDAGKVLASSKNFETGNDINYVFIAEPILTTVLNNKEVATYQKAYTYLNIQDEYYKKTNKSLISASLFIKNDANKDSIDAYLENLEKNINKLLNDQEYVDELLKANNTDELTSVYGLNSNMIKDVLKDNSIGLCFIKASENVNVLNEFINLFGMDSINEEIIYK